MKKIYIGLDIGTTAIKISAVDAYLTVIYEKQYRYDYQTPQKDWCEIDPEIWLQLVLRGLQELLQELPAEQIQGMGITGQMHTTVFVDQQGRAVRPAILWNDQRTAALLPEIQRKLLAEAETAQIAKIVSTGSPLANLVWLKEQEPENYRKTAQLLIAKDYLVWRLSGVYSTDYCDASTSSLYDLAQDCWSETVQRVFEFDRTVFPPINASAKLVGRLQPEILQQLGITVAIPLTAGTGDNVASALVSGCFDTGQPLLSLGTSGVVVIPNHFHQFKEQGKNVVVKIREEDHMIITQGTVQAGAKTNSWWLEKILATDDFAQEQAAISPILQDRSEVLFFPHLNGEKTLYGEPELRGAFVGLSLATTRAEMYLAVLEGLAFGMRQLYEAMRNNDKPEYFTIVGGGAKSALWIQLFADILACPVRHEAGLHEAVHGAAVLAIIGTEGHFQFRKSVGRLTLPDHERSQKYQAKYRHYQQLTSAMLAYTKAVKVI